MKYNKTNWIDNKTPVNAANLNKIEDGIYRLCTYALTANSISSGNNINVTVSEAGLVSINMKPIFINGIELLGDKSAESLGLVRTIQGKGLSTNDYTSRDKMIVDALAGVELYTKEEVDELVDRKIAEALEGLNK